MAFGESRRMAAALAMAGCAAARAAPWTQQDIDRMSAPGTPQALMLAVCGGNAQIDALRALASEGVKATVFVSGKALSDAPLRALLASRPDLFEVGNLGSECSSRRALAAGLPRDRSRSERDSREATGAVEHLAASMLAGSKEIQAKLGVKPRFFAFGLDFDQASLDPYVQDRLVSGALDYLSKPTPAARYDLLASSKAVFDAWVVLAKLDRGQPGRLAGPDSYSQGAIEQGLASRGASKTAKKASEAWSPKKRASLASELPQGQPSGATAP